MCVCHVFPSGVCVQARAQNSKAKTPFSGPTLQDAQVPALSASTGIASRLTQNTYEKGGMMLSACSGSWLSLDSPLSDSWHHQNSPQCFLGVSKQNRVGFGVSFTMSYHLWVLSFCNGGEGTLTTSFPSCSLPLTPFKRVEFSNTNQSCLILAWFMCSIKQTSALVKTPLWGEALPLWFAKTSPPNCPCLFLQFLSQPVSRGTPSDQAFSFHQRSFFPAATTKPLEIVLSSSCQQLSGCSNFFPLSALLSKHPPKLLEIFQET